MTEEKKLQVTSGKEWRKDWEEGELVQLSPDHAARLRHVSLLFLIKTGKPIPDPLTEKITQMLEGKKAKETEKLTLTLDDIREVEGLSREVCKAGFIEPKIVDQPQKDDEIPYEALTDSEATTAFRWILGREVEALEPFRDEQKGDVEGLPRGKNVRDEAERTAGD